MKRSEKEREREREEEGLMGRGRRVEMVRREEEKVQRGLFIKEEGEGEKEVREVNAAA